MQNKFVRTDEWPTNVSQSFASGFLRQQRKRRERRSVRKIKMFSAHIDVNNVHEEYGGGLLFKYLTGNKLYFI